MQFYYLILLFTVVAAYKAPFVVDSQFEPVDDDSSNPLKNPGESNYPLPPEAPVYKSPSSPELGSANDDGGYSDTRTGPVPSIFDSFLRHINDMHQRFMSNFFSPLAQYSDETSEAPVEETAEVPFMTKLLDNIFGSFFGKPDESFISNPEHKAVFDMPSVDDLPPNYKNSTSEIRRIGNSHVQVNQTIHKNSDKGKNDYFVFKIINFLPRNITEQLPGDQIELNNEQVGNEQAEAGNAQINDQKVGNEQAINEHLKKVDFNLNEINENHNNNLPKDRNEDYLIHRLLRKARSIEVDLPKKAIAFPPNQLDRFPHSFVNNKNVKSEDIKRLLSDSRSKSFVYKDIGGKTVFYIVNHKAKPVGSGTIDSSKNPEVEMVEPAGKPDLRRDTLVNPSGGDGEQQGLVQVDPDAEVFDLSLLIKEIESRPKN